MTGMKGGIYGDTKTDKWKRNTEQTVTLQIQMTT